MENNLYIFIIMIHHFILTVLNLNLLNHISNNCPCRIIFSAPFSTLILLIRNRPFIYFLIVFLLGRLLKHARLFDLFVYFSLTSFYIHMIKTGALGEMGENWCRQPTSIFKKKKKKKIKVFHFDLIVWIIAFEIYENKTN